MPRRKPAQTDAPEAEEQATTEPAETEARDSGPVEERTEPEATEPEASAPESGDEPQTDAADEDPGVAPTDVPDGVRGGDEQCPHGVDGGCPLCSLDAEVASAPSDEPEPEDEPEPLGPALPDFVDDEEWAALVAEYGEDVDLPLADGEEITGQRTEDDGDLIVVTNFGRKLGISPDGWIVVLTGTPLDVEAAAVPNPPRKSWKDPR